MKELIVRLTQTYDTLDIISYFSYSNTLHEGYPQSYCSFVKFLAYYIHSQHSSFAPPKKTARVRFSEV